MSSFSGLGTCRVLAIAVLVAAATACAHADGRSAQPFSCGMSGHTLTVHLPGNSSGVRNPKHLGIATDSSFGYLMDRSVPADLLEFDANTRTLELDVRTQKAIRYVHAKARKTRAFPAPGEYELIFSDNLETEPDNTFSLSCSVSVSVQALDR